MKRQFLSIMLFGMILLATGLGWFAQDLAYIFETIQAPYKNLTVVTIASVALYLVTFIISTICLSLEKLTPKMYMALFTTTLLVGGITSAWSLFVLAMWLG